MSHAWFLIPLAGFLGSFHCAAMCGPFVGFYRLNGGSGGWPHHIAYQSGRLTAYVGLGTAVGWLGSQLLFLSGMLQAQRFLMWAMGLAMIGLGLAYYLPSTPLRRRPWLSHHLASFTAKLRPQAHRPQVAAMIGLCSTLLPCGYLYGFAFSAGASGNPVTGALIMAGFWLGTLPALLGMGFLAGRLSKVWLVRFQHTTPLFLITFGCLALAGRWIMFPDHLSADGPLCYGF